MGNITLQEINNKSIVDQIVDNFTNAIIDGTFQPGEKIPTESEICESMHVSRNSVREAIKILIAYGVLVIRRGDGTYVKDKFDEKMLYPILYGIILQKDSAKQILELRKIIDVGIIQLSMDHITDNSMKLLEKGLHAFKNTLMTKGVSASAIFDADIAFHTIIVEIAGNDLLVGLCRYIDRITKASRLKTTELILSQNAIEDLYAKHEEIVRVFKENDKAKINNVVESHYQYWQMIENK